MIESELLKSIKHMALATVNEDGTPHNTPLFFAIGDNLENLIFVSRSESLHSKNFVRTGKGFAVLYDSNTFLGGLYLKIINGRKAKKEELMNVFKIYDAALSRWQIDVLPEGFHLSTSGYNLYVGDIEKIEVYKSEEDSQGKLINESRREVTAEELQND